jgi:hypothetical protein
MDGTGRGQHNAGAFAAATRVQQNPANTAARGRAGGGRTAALTRQAKAK